jgi:hypothetical protein
MSSTTETQFSGGSGAILTGYGPERVPGAGLAPPSAIEVSAHAGFPRPGLRAYKSPRHVTVTLAAL